MGHLPLRFGQWFALLGRHQLSKVVDIGWHQVVPLPQEHTALLRRSPAPVGPRVFGSFDRALLGV